MTFAVGLSTSLNRVVGGLSHAAQEPVQLYPNSQNSFTFTAAQQRTVQAALRAQPGTPALRRRRPTARSAWPG